MFLIIEVVAAGGLKTASVRWEGCYNYTREVIKCCLDAVTSISYFSKLTVSLEYIYMLSPFYHHGNNFIDTLGNKHGLIAMIILPV